MKIYDGASHFEINPRTPPSDKIKIYLKIFAVT